MDGGRISLMKNGSRVRFADDDECALLSPRSWHGCRLEVHRLPAAGSVQHQWNPQPVILVTLRGTAQLQLRSGTRRLAFASAAEQVSVFGSGFEMDALEWKADQAVRCVIELSQLESPCSGDYDKHRLNLNLRHEINVADAQIAILASAMRTEIEAGCPSGRIYAESLSLALAARLSSQYSARGNQAQDVTVRLAPTQLVRVKDYVREHIGEDIGVSTLAAVAGLSPYHFSRLFKAAVGMTPHQYLLHERAGKGLTLLEQTTLAISDIALSLGFASQSHFSEIFRKIYGASPKAVARKR